MTFAPFSPFGKKARGGIVQDNLVFNFDASNPQSYPMDGETWFDLSPNGYTATAFNSPIFEASPTKCFLLDGVNQYFQTDISGTYGKATFEVWWFFDDPTLNILLREGSLFGDWNAVRIHFAARWSGSAAGLHWNVNGAWTKLGSAQLKYGWNHYALVWDKILNKKMVYQNGVKIDERGTNGDIVIGDFKIGVATNLNRYARGKISEIRMYDAALTEEQIVQNRDARLLSHIDP